MVMEKSPDEFLASVAVHEIEEGKRFSFGENWKRFLVHVNELRIAESQEAITSMLPVDLHGKSFLDCGSGSGLSSLSAIRSGARVVSFDFDPQSVACTRYLKETFAQDADSWDIRQGSVLDPEFMKGLGKHDVVYSWGVLHHTGQMWKAIDLVQECVNRNGCLFLALYNDQKWISTYWLLVKKLYNFSWLTKIGMIAVHAPYLLLGRMIVHALRGQKTSGRGMAIWYDMLDWLGGLPFETATPEGLEAYLAKEGFVRVKSRLVGKKHGCFEMVFKRIAGD